MNVFSFAPATREQARARIGLQGPAGSGKTKSALRIAEGLAQGGAIGLIDTERRSALTYAPVPGRPELGGHEFGHMPMDTHDPRHLIQAIEAAKRADIAVLIVDSWSHFWNGRGGLLTIVEEAGRKPGAGGSFGGWREGNPIEQDMLDALLNFPGHVIATMRTKGDYVIEGKKVTKVGVKAVQREGAEYELGLILDMVEGTGTVTKTRYEPLEGLTIHHPGEDLAEIILGQLGQGVDPAEAIMTELTAEGLTYQGALALHAKAKSRGLLETGQLHPVTGDPSTIGALIAEYGKALRPAPAPASAPAPPVADQAPVTGAIANMPHRAMEWTKGTEPEQTEDKQAAPASVPNQPTDSAAVTAPQMRKIFATLADLGFDNGDRARRLTALSLLVGREVTSQNDLTFGEGSVVIETLADFTGEDASERFREYLNTLLSAAQQPAAAA
ncbi:MULTISPECIES: AAA family ATPase [Streptomyces]|uniref:AAA family ATPase n=1 Tax=Streptomyces flavovirens TaxID=52258 RepID=A0ABV8NAQ5_9ACTN|nr:AAA family ATPase [Streptomyces sp. MBT51]MBK3595774.1 AAA family ATPase [Streptomyces sp. MBT51]